uniref:Lysozyme n=1 Tax=Acrobeloides nanus TaxID=290746 RepID=A0A914CID3_9BILA
MKLVTLIALALVIRASYATLGFDAISTLTSSTFQCLGSNGYSFFIARVGRSNGQVDTVGVQNIKNARSAGWTNVDAYIFPCTASCASASNQVQNAINAIKNAGTTVGTIWLDIEILSWPSNTATNRQFITDMVNTVQNNGYRVGIYTNANNWNTIVGAWTGTSSLPLWWAKYDGQQNFGSFSPFGGWSAPTIKQYEGDVNGPCGVSLDQNWRP